MRDGLFQPFNNSRRNDRVEIFGGPIRLARLRDPRVNGKRGGIPAHGAAGIEQHFNERRKVCRRAGTIDEQSLGRAANTGAPEFGIE